MNTFEEGQHYIIDDKLGSYQGIGGMQEILFGNEDADEIDNLYLSYNNITQEMWQDIFDEEEIEDYE